MGEAQNFTPSLVLLGGIYYEGKYIEGNIRKAIHYYTLAAELNDSEAEYCLGIVYIEGKYFPPNIKKAIYYFTLAAKQHSHKAQYELGLLYDQGKYVPRDIKKAIYYYSMASKKNNKYAQYYLGVIFCDESNALNKYKEGIFLLTESSKKSYDPANFVLGYLYHVGKHVNLDINKAIHYYKEASSFNNKHAKNNLAVIYLNGYKDIISPNIPLAIEYFQEAIRKSNDLLSMFNLAHYYLYGQYDEKILDKSIELFIKLPYKKLLFVIDLLCLALIKRYQNNFENIAKKLGQNQELICLIQELIKDENLYDPFYFNRYYENFRSIFVIYNNVYNAESYSKNNYYKGRIINEKSKKIADISKEFYEGFGIDLSEI